MNLPLEIADLSEELADVISQSMTATPNDMVAFIREIRRAKSRLTDAERLLEAALAERMPKKLNEDGSYEKRWSPSSTTWDHDFILPRLLAAARDERILNTATGEIEPTEDALLRVVKEAAGIGYWRVTALKRLGLNVEDCREQSGGRWTIQLHQT